MFGDVPRKAWAAIGDPCANRLFFTTSWNKVRTCPTMKSIPFPTRENRTYSFQPMELNTVSSRNKIIGTEFPGKWNTRTTSFFHVKKPTGRPLFPRDTCKTKQKTRTRIPHVFVLLRAALLQAQLRRALLRGPRIDSMDGDLVLGTWKWQEMAGNGRKWQEMAGNGRKWQVTWAKYATYVPWEDLKCSIVRA